jgi:hypothetical protein
MLMAEHGQNYRSKMTKIDNKIPEIIGSKQGVPIYRSNPSIPEDNSISKRKKVRFGNEQKGFIFDNKDGDIISVGGAGFYEFEEVDNTKFVKLFLEGVKKAAGLSKSGLNLFEVVYRELQGRPGEDRIILNYYTASEYIDGLTDRTYRRGLRELLDKEFLYRSPSEGVFFVNIRFMFNGDRISFLKGYQRKGAKRQKELEFSSDDIEETSE